MVLAPEEHRIANSLPVKELPPSSRKPSPVVGDRGAIAPPARRDARQQAGADHRGKNGSALHPDSEPPAKPGDKGHVWGSLWPNLDD